MKNISQLKLDQNHAEAIKRFSIEELCEEKEFIHVNVKAAGAVLAFIAVLAVAAFSIAGSHPGMYAIITGSNNIPAKQGIINTH